MSGCHRTGCWLAVVLLVVGCGAVPPAAAHRVNVFAWVEGDTVHTESAFSGGRRVRGGTITVFAPGGRKLLEGTTDDEGAFAFTVPQITDLRIVLQAGAGHAGEWTVAADEIRAAQNEEGSFRPAAAQDASAYDAGPATAQARKPADVVPAGLTREDVAAVVEDVLERKLDPVTRMLARRQQTEPGLRDVLGGIGYILGLVGLAAYLHARRRTRGPH